MKTATHYTDLPAELHRQTLYDWGRRGLRTYHGFQFKGATGPAWRHQFEAIPARSGQARLLRRISSRTTEWVAVARRRGQFWAVAYYLVPRTLAVSLAKAAVERVPAA